MTDEGGVLGNLPNSRPGKRSAKRDRPSGTAAKAAARAEAGGKAAAKPPRTGKAQRTSPKPGAAAAGKASPRGRTAAASQRERTAAVKGSGSGDGVRVDPVYGGKVGHDPDSAGTPGDAVGAVVRGAAGLAVTGVKVAGAVTQELLRRLPRR